MILKAFVARLRRDERGTSAVEMGLICAMIVLVMLGALRSFAEGTSSMWGNVSSSTEEAVQGATG